MKMIKLALAVIAHFFLAAPGFTEDKLPLPYNTTFNCPEAVFNNNANRPDCDHLPSAWQAYSNVAGGPYTAITSAANFPNGAGGRGIRFYIGPTTNDSSSGINYEPTTTGNKEVWVRWYTRWQPGFSYGTDGNNGHKAVYFNNDPYFNWGGNFLRITDGVFIRIVGGFGLWDIWNSSGKSFTADGSWVCSEIHYKVETSPGAGNGVAEWWINNVKRMGFNDINYGAPANGGFNFFGLPANGNGNTSGSYMWQDFDDVAISTTGRIGCPYSTSSGASSAAPLPPANLKVE